MVNYIGTAIQILILGSVGFLYASQEIARVRDSSSETDRRLSRRQYLITAGGGVAALAGCSGGDADGDSPEETTDGNTTEPTATATPSETEMGMESEPETPSPEPASMAVFDWEHFGYDRQNSGSIGARGPPEEPEQQWHREIAPVPGTMALKDGVLYVPSNDGEDSTV